MRVVRTRLGVRLVEGGLVLSEVAARPVATHSLFDVLAATVTALSAGPRVLLLGFAGGGLVAPLRAMGFGHPLVAVDLDLSGERIFREVCGSWAGDVRVHRDDAVRFLRRRRARWDLVLEDLSVPTPLGVTKPGVSLDLLPGLVARRLARRGIAVSNLLPVPGRSWPEALESAATPWPRAQVVHLADYENRVLLAGPGLPADSRTTSAALRRHLRAIGSREALLVSVRSLVPRATRRRRRRPRGRGAAGPAGGP